MLRARREGKLRSEGRGFGERQQAGYDPEDWRTSIPIWPASSACHVGHGDGVRARALHPGNRKRDQGLTRADILNAAPKRVRQGNVLREEGEDAQVRGNGIVGATRHHGFAEGAAGSRRPEPAREEHLGAAPPAPARKSPRAASTSSSTSEFEPAGDQPTAIAELVEGVQRHERDQVLLGVTGSGKTFTMAQVIARTNRPALILAPNKTLAAQLYGEFKSFFPDNAVEYFVSYYDYYQPEAYVPRTDTYIEKESSINEQIDRMRHSATRALLERDDVIIVASVSCIYGIGSVETYTAMTFAIKVGERLDQRQLLADLVALQYKRIDGRLPARHVPRARRRDRDLPGPLRGPRLAHQPVRRRGGVDRRVRPADRHEDPPTSNSSRSTPTRIT